MSKLIKNHHRSKVYKSEDSEAPCLLSIVVPAYNEANNLNLVIQELIITVDSLLPDYELIIVNDGSSDQTGQIAGELEYKYTQIQVLHHDKNLGHGKALLTGFRSSHGEWITSVPADGQIDPADFSIFLPLLNEADFVSSYYLNRKNTIKRKILTWGLWTIIRLLFGKIPQLQGTRFFRRKLLDNIDLRSETSMLNLELLIAVFRKGYRIKEVPIHFRPRESGESKVVNLKTICRYFWDIFKLRIFYLRGDRE